MESESKLDRVERALATHDDEGKVTGCEIREYLVGDVAWHLDLEGVDNSVRLLTVNVHPGFLRGTPVVGTVRAIIEGRANFVGFEREEDPMIMFRERMRRLGYETPEAMLTGLEAADRFHAFRAQVEAVGGKAVRHGGRFEGNEIRLEVHVKIADPDRVHVLDQWASRLGIDTVKYECPNRARMPRTVYGEPLPNEKPLDTSEPPFDVAETLGSFARHEARQDETIAAMAQELRALRTEIAALRGTPPDPSDGEALGRAMGARR